jgi:Ca-activated chloride channel family protein
MRFLQPEAASWFLIVPLVVCAWFLHAFLKRRFRRQVALNRHLLPISRVSSWRRDAIALLAGVAAVVLLVLAMTRPQILLQMRFPEYEKEDLILILDRSVSMRAEDVPPSRFSRAVAEIKTFLANKPDTLDRIALVGFANTSLMLSPLTNDMNNLYFYLDWLEQDLEPRFGTNIGNALANAREVVSKDKQPTRKVFLIVSDGDDQGTELDAQIGMLRDEQIHVYTIGIGSDKPSFIPIPGPNDTMENLQFEGKLVMTEFNETTLRNIASLTGGRFVRSTTGTELAQAMREAVERERRVVGWNTSVQYRDLYRECLAAAALATFVLLLAL